MQGLSGEPFLGLCKALRVSSSSCYSANRRLIHFYLILQMTKQDRIFSVEKTTELELGPGHSGSQVTLILFVPLF